MVTFTLPYELRSLAWAHQTKIYTLLFSCASSTLKDFGLNPKNLGAEIGLTAILHTHTRQLAYHPHLHVIVPGGGIHRARKQWKKKKGKYLFQRICLGQGVSCTFSSGPERRRSDRAQLITRQMGHRLYACRSWPICIEILVAISVPGRHQ